MDQISQFLVSKKCTLYRPVQAKVDFLLSARVHIIGGHGFWGKGGVHTGGVSKKIFRPPSATKKFLRQL